MDASQILVRPDSRPISFMTRPSCLFALLAIVLNAQASFAGYIYNYTGNVFTEFVDPFTATDSVSGYLEFGVTPTPNGMLEGGDVVDYSLAVGNLLTLDRSNSFLDIGSFHFDNQVELIGWTVGVAASGAHAELDYIVTTSVDSFSNGTEDFVPGDLVVLADGFNSVYDDPGIWVAQSTAIPEVGSLTLCGIGVATMGCGWWRRRRRRSPSCTATMQP